MGSQEKIRRVFISDIHMGNERSINQVECTINTAGFMIKAPPLSAIDRKCWPLSSISIA